ncbi:hypothetical protein TPA0598_04_03650 [Streptomyces lydicamycinicus]|uniref:Uncharacterized protein n=2 Tax=Streptomyces lydicamycinicus TaxID=1546107 RepID=A0A0P4R840_9ACTN|nr:hypothetical protein TPA0598_04_03650 [Streptomyces lydicamycinicus]
MRQEMGVVLLGLVEHANADWRRSGVFVHVASRWPTWLRARLRPVSFIGIDRDDQNLGAAFYRYDHGPIGTTWARKEALAENWQQICADLRVDWESKRAAGVVDPKSRIGRIVKSPMGQWFARSSRGRKITGSTRWRARVDSWLWNRIDNNERWRMTLSEFRDVEHYHYLVTWPIRDPRNRHVVGVLSADVRPRRGRPVDVDLNGPIAGALNTAAGHIQELVRRGGRDA